MISVLFLIPTLDRGGAENVLVDLVNHMDQSRFQITVQTLFDQDSQKDRLRKGIEYRSFLKHQFRGNSRLFARIPAGLLYRLIVRKRYDIAVSFLEGPTTHIISGCPYSDSKRIAWIHSALNTDRGLTAGFISKKAAAHAYKEFDKLVFVAESARKTVEETVGHPLLNAVVLYNAIDAEVILNKAKEQIPDDLFCKNEINIISTGKIVFVKGYDRLARVQKKLIDSGHKTHIYILGEGKEHETIESYVRDNAVSDRFSFLGYQSNPYKYVARADMFVCSSRREGFSTAVSEALILGIPVVSTDCSGSRELLGMRNEYGIVTENNEEALFQGISNMIDNTSLYEHYREQARIRGRQFRIENQVKAVEDELLGILRL